MSAPHKSPFNFMVDPAPALDAARRLAQTLPKQVSSMDLRKGKALNDEMVRFDEELERT